MGIFDFNKQTMRADLRGQTLGKEMFKVQEYNERKATTFKIISIEAALLTFFYFGYKIIPMKIFIFLIILCLGLGFWGYHNYKEQTKLREKLYD